MTQMLPDPKLKCHHTGFAKSCRELVSDPEFACPKFIRIVGANPNTGEPIDKYGCSDSFMHMLLIEQAKETRQAAAAIESFRNETVLNDRVGLRIQAEAVARLPKPA